MALPMQDPSSARLTNLLARTTGLTITSQTLPSKLSATQQMTVMICSLELQQNPSSASSGARLQHKMYHKDMPQTLSAWPYRSQAYRQMHDGTHHHACTAKPPSLCSNDGQAHLSSDERNDMRDCRVDTPILLPASFRACAATSPAICTFQQRRSHLLRVDQREEF